MTLFDMEKAVAEAKGDLMKADMCVERMVKLIVGRLRKASKTYDYAYNLVKLKRELRKFNIHTKQWID